MALFPAGGRVYTVNNMAVTISTAITVIQIKAGANNPLWLVRASLTQRPGITNNQERIQILRKTGAATVSAFTPLLYDSAGSGVGDPAAAAVGGTTATGITGTAEGTNGDILVSRGFSVLTGFEWIPTAMEMIKVPPAGIIAMVFPNAPVSQVWDAQMVFCE